jgi:hypothetical protein
VSAEPSSGSGTGELVGSFLAVVSIVASLLALVYNPLRLTPFAVLLGLISVGMSPRSARLPALAIGVAVICFIVGLTIAVTTNNPIY